MISGDSSRTQATNLQECYKKLHDAIVAAGRSTVRGETAPGKIERVRVLYAITVTLERVMLTQLP